MHDADTACVSADDLNLSNLTLQDSQDPNPLIRALAVRTMGCIRVDKITEYLCDPLQRCLKVGMHCRLTFSHVALSGESRCLSMACQRHHL